MECYARRGYSLKAETFKLVYLEVILHRKHLRMQRLETGALIETTIDLFFATEQQYSCLEALKTTLCPGPF